MTAQIRQTLQTEQKRISSTVQNSASGVDSKSKRAQLFGDLGSIPAATSGKCGDSSDVIYFKKIFERVSVNQPTASGAN